MNPNLKNGWYLVCVDEFALGWGKVSNGTLKNTIPIRLASCLRCTYAESFELDKQPGSFYEAGFRTGRAA